MKFADLQEKMWRELPFFRRNVVGRDRIDDLVTIAIEQSPIEFIQHISQGSNEEEVLIATWSRSVKRSYCLVRGADEAEFGPLFWLLISPLLQILLQKLLEWWFESRTNRVLMAGWQRRMTK
jgi:hypothetical protein